MKVWVVSGTSESADHFEPLVFSKKPSQRTLKKIARTWDADDESDGPGDFGTYVYLDVNEVEVDGEIE